MSAYQLSDMQQFLRDRNQNDTTGRAERDYVRIANGVCGLIRAARTWDFDKRYASIKLIAPYSDGTILSYVGGSGSSLHGTGTTWTELMIGRFVWLPTGRTPALLPYEILDYFSATELEIEPYLEDPANLVGVNYYISNERVPLPTGFRCFEKPDRGDWLWDINPLKDLRDLFRWRMATPLTGTPTAYGIEFKPDATNTPSPYLWLYPGPGYNMQVNVGYYAWGPALVDGTDTFGVPDTAISADMIEQYALAYLAKQQGNQSEFDAHLAFASEYANQVCASMRPITEDEPGRQPYRPDGPGRLRYIVVKPGIVQP